MVRKEEIRAFPKPYKGSETYIFVSYAHKNIDAALGIVTRLIQEGYRVWYDEGIDPGVEWDENIASKIVGCSYFIALMSKDYLASTNCKDEINYARDKEKIRLLIYLEETELPNGMSMRLNRLQAIHKYTYSDQEEFFEKLFEADGIQSCLGEKTGFSMQHRSKVNEYVMSYAAKNNKWIYGVVGIVAVIALVLLYPLLAHREAKPVEQEAMADGITTVEQKREDSYYDLRDFQFGMSVEEAMQAEELRMKGLPEDGKATQNLESCNEYENGETCIKYNNVPYAGKTAFTMLLFFDENGLYKVKYVFLEGVYDAACQSLEEELGKPYLEKDIYKQWKVDDKVEVMVWKNSATETWIECFCS